MEVNQQKWARWNAFVSLNWYDGFIEFLFRFVAKTSEPLLALGIVISAVDFLMKGALLSSNQPLTLAWAWTQAIAIEASSGVVFVYALQSFRTQDALKGRLYLALSVLLAITGGAMLLFQLIANTTNTNEGALPLGVFYVLAVLRVLVSISYVYMCRAKHIRFSDLKDIGQNTEGANIAHDEAIKQLAEQMSLLAQNMGQITATVTEVKTTVTQITAASLPALPMPTEHLVNTVESDPLERRVPAHKQRPNPQKVSPVNKKEVIRQYLLANPQASVSEIMEHAKVARSYASMTRSQIQNEQQKGQ
jgi:hypothetical protein